MSAWWAGKRMACVAVVAAAGVGLGLSVHQDAQFTAQVTTADHIAGTQARMRQEECIYDAIRAKVPKGATVYVAGNPAPPAQRLAELSTLWAVPAANISHARYRLTLVPPHGRSIVPFPLTAAAPDPAQGRCAGMKLKVGRL